MESAIHGDAIPAMPLNGRNFIQLATFAPGVALPQGTQLPRINGGRPTQTNISFDGISALQPEPGQVAFFPIVDDIQEIDVDTNGVPAEFGRFNGGVVNLSTRGGSNTFHGSLYEFLRNENLNARNYFAPPAQASLNSGATSMGTLGGPIFNQAIVNPEGALWCLRVRCELGYGCHTTSSRCVHFLAEECVAEFLEQFVCFHWFWFVLYAARLNFLRPSSPNRCTSSVASDLASCFA